MLAFVIHQHEKHAVRVVERVGHVSSLAWSLFGWGRRSFRPLVAGVRYFPEHMRHAGRSDPGTPVVVRHADDLMALHGIDDLADAEPDTMRFRPYHLPACLADHARHRRLPIERTWPWAKVPVTAGHARCPGQAGEAQAAGAPLPRSCRSIAPHTGDLHISGVPDDLDHPVQRDLRHPVVGRGCIHSAVLLVRG
jgi:hypothetical protein